MTGPAPAGALVEREEELAAIVRGMRRIAVLGIQDEDRPDAPAYTIPALLDAMGFEIVGINPTRARALGRPTLAALAELPAGVDVLDVFRRSSGVAAHTDELLALPPARRPRVVWLQTGIRDDASAQRLAAAGMRVVQDHCLGVYARRYR